MTITIPITDIVTFIHYQPHNKSVDMNQCNSGDPTGCVMVHYGFEKLNFLGRFYCGAYVWGKYQHRLSHSIHSIFEGNIFQIPEKDKPKTYGELRELLEPEYRCGL